MSASTNTPNKIARLRTFAQDAEKHANRSIDEVRAGHSQTKEDDTAKRPSTSSEVVDLDSVDTEETTEKATASIPKKSIPPATYKEKSSEAHKPATEPTSTDQTDQNNSEEKDISNPPFHKLDAERKKAAEKIGASSGTIVNHPESLLSGENKQTIAVDDDEATAEATIVTDTKTSRKTVIDDIGDSISDWFNKVKNTYITPPKPSYTVSKSERRAGILHDATGKTGTDLVDHDSFAARIRERYQNAAQPNSEVETEPAWLPSLPASDKRNISEVQTIPRKSVHTPQPEYTERTKQTAADESLQPDNKTSEPATQKTSVPLTKKSKEATSDDATTSLPKATTQTDSKLATVPKKEEIENAPTTEPEDVNTKETAATEINQPPTKTPETPPVPPPVVKKEIPSTPVTKPAPEQPAAPKEETSQPDKATSNAEPETVKTQTPSQPVQEQPKRVEDEDLLADSPAKTQIKAETYTTPSDQELDEEAMWSDRQATNRLSLGIVFGTTVTIVAGIVVYSVAPLFLNQTNEPAQTVNAAFGDDIQTIESNEWEDSLALTQAVSEAMSADIARLHYIAIETNGTPTTDAGQLTQLLNIEIPISVQTNLLALYTGNYQGTPFLYLHAPDTTQILGAMLAWETSLTEDLQALLPLTDHSGQFVDTMINDTYDARVKQSKTNAPTMTYALVGDYFLITTTPEAATTIISSLSHTP